MAKISIKNFGPIKAGYTENQGFLELGKTTVFIGNQGSGKSTVAKLVSVFAWMEKALTRGDFNPEYFSKHHRFRKNFCAYHRLENYFFDAQGNDQAELAYQGLSYNFSYTQGRLHIEAKQKDLFESKQEDTAYLLPQIMYVPAERNFIGNVKTPRALQLTSDALVDFVSEFDRAKNEVKGLLDLPIQGTKIEYHKLNDVLYLHGEDYKIQLKEASSGYQSLIPLFLVSWYLTQRVQTSMQNDKGGMSSEEQERFRKNVASIWANPDLTEEQRRIAISALSAKFNKKAFINIVEEPEQNLFPHSQRDMLYSLLTFNNLNAGNRLLMTTHSPYLIHYLTLAVEAQRLKAKLEDKPDLMQQLHAIVPLSATLDGKDLLVYQLDEKTGAIHSLKSYRGLPSDENYLNDGLAETNTLFSKLLDIEDLCQ